LFDVDNPAYAAQEFGRKRLADDAVELAVGALCTLSQTELTSAEPDLAEVGGLWWRAVTASSAIGGGTEIQQRITELALGRADTLNRRDKLAEAIPVLEAALPALTGPHRDRVAGQLANLFANRGIRAANENMANAAAAMADLRRAMDLNPHLIRARSSLGVLVFNSAMDMLKRASKDMPSAYRLLKDAMGVLGTVVDLMDEGLRDVPGQRELTELRSAAVKERDAITATVAVVEAHRRAGGR
jgi:tetratricopeptide (TPR) repeat protein